MKQFCGPLMGCCPFASCAQHFSRYLLPCKSWIFERMLTSASTDSVKVLVALSCPNLCAAPWTVAHQAPLSMGFSRQEYWSGLPFPSPGDLPDPGIKPRFPALEADSLLSELPGKPTEAGHKLKRQSSLLLKDKLLENAKRI